MIGAALALLAAPVGCDAAAVSRIDVSAAQSALSDGLPDWREASVALSRRFDGGWAGAVRVEALERFGLKDVYGEARIERWSGDGHFYAAAGGAADADFKPEAALKFGGAVSVAASTMVSFDLDASRFASGDVYATKLGAEKTWSPLRVTTSLQAIAVSEEGGPVLVGYAVQGSVPVTPRVSARLTYVQAPETSEGVVTRVRGLGGGVRFEVSDAWIVRADALHEDRGAYTRNELSLGFARRF